MRTTFKNYWTCAHGIREVIPAIGQILRFIHTSIVRFHQHAAGKMGGSSIMPSVQEYWPETTQRRHLAGLEILLHEFWKRGLIAAVDVLHYGDRRIVMIPIDF